MTRKEWNTTPDARALFRKVCLILSERQLEHLFLAYFPIVAEYLSVQSVMTLLPAPSTVHELAAKRLERDKHILHMHETQPYRRRYEHSTYPAEHHMWWLLGSNYSQAPDEYISPQILAPLRPIVLQCANFIRDMCQLVPTAEAKDVICGDVALFNRKRDTGPYLTTRVQMDPRWHTNNVLELAKAIYLEKAFERMPILADALMDAGCDDERIISHCHTSPVHICGCWVLESILKF